MSISLKNYESFESNQTQSLTVSIAARKGDWIVLVVTNRSVLNTPAGYTLLRNESFSYDGVTQTQSFFAKKVTSDGTESVTLTQSGTGRIYTVILDLGGVENVVYNSGYRSIYYSPQTGTASFTIQKQEAGASCVWGISTIYALNDATINFVFSPSNDITYIRSGKTGVGSPRENVVFDDGHGALSHTVTYAMEAAANPYMIDAVVLIPAVVKKYLIEDENVLYTIQNGALVQVSGNLSAALFQSDGFDDTQNIGSLLMTLTSPTVHAWSDSEQVNISAQVEVIPEAQNIIANAEPLIDVVDVSNISATYTGNPLFAFQIDGGQWKKYDAGNSAWTNAGTNGGNAVSELQALGSSAWLDLFQTATTVRVRVSLNTTSDTLSEIVIELVEE